MRILVTGAAGCPGRAGRRQAAGRHEVVAVDLDPGGDAEVNVVGLQGLLERPPQPPQTAPDDGTGR